MNTGAEAWFGGSSRRCAGGGAVGSVQAVWCSGAVGSVQAVGAVRSVQAVVQWAVCGMCSGDGGAAGSVCGQGPADSVCAVGQRTVCELCSVRHALKGV